MSLRSVAYLLFTLMMVVPVRGSAALAQLPPVARAAISGGVGLAEGAVVSLAIMVARARFEDEYVESPSDVIAWGWQAVPVLVAPLAGLTFGLRGKDAFAGSLLGSASGLVIGATVGGLIGRLTSNSSESVWAGAIMGAGAGLTIGRVLLGVLQWNERHGAQPRPIAVAFQITP